MDRSSGIAGGGRRCRLRPTSSHEPDRPDEVLADGPRATSPRSSRSTTTAITLDSALRRRPRRRLARADRAGRGARGGARRAHRRLLASTTTTSATCAPSATRSTTSCSGWEGLRPEGRCRRCRAEALEPGFEIALGWTFRDDGLLDRRRSRTARGAPSTGTRPSNERLEFLGDSVLGLVVTDYVFEHLPAAPRRRAGQGARRRW